MNKELYAMRRHGLAALLLALCVPGAIAAQKGDSISYTFTGRLVAQSFCSVNNDQPIEVPFGNVGINKVASGQYIQSIDYSLVCKGAPVGATVDLMVQSAQPAVWDARAVATDVPGLGIHILNAGSPLALNTPLTVDPDSPPQLQAQLVADPSTALVARAFSATSTLLASYY